MMPSRVLVTGGSGFVAAHCILRLLAAGHAVRTTVRSLKREQDVRAMLRRGGAEPGAALEFVEADLMQDYGWPEAVAGCDHVLHVASPLQAAEPKDENELIVPAREGAVRVLRAARDAGVRRVVLTSSYAAIGYGQCAPGGVYTEANWTDTSVAVGAYIKSKTFAERAAWDFIAREGQGMELACVNPTVILGPVLGPDLSTSIELIKSMLEGKAPALPKLMYGVVDVRDVADLHLLAMTHPAAAGERFLCVSGDFLTVQQIAQALRDGTGPIAARVSTRVLPNWVVRLAALFSPTARLAATPELGRRKTASNEKARRVLGWSPRPPREAIVATALSLVDLGLVKRKG